MQYIAHIRERDGTIQAVGEHLKAVGELAASFAVPGGLSNLARLSGILHDMGKYSDAFTNYIIQAVTNPDSPPKRGSVDHSTAGGRWIYRKYHNGSLNMKQEEMIAAEWIAMCIISHHGGLRDFLGPDLESEFLERVAKKELDDYEEAAARLREEFEHKDLDHLFHQAADEIRLVIEKIQLKYLHTVTATLALKYVFSCLIDADRTDTREFEEGEVKQEDKDCDLFFRRCYNSLMDHIQQLEVLEDAGTQIHQLRGQMSRECEAFADNKPGIYRLSIPTGGGKTLASLRYALKHAMLHGQERIVFIVPYTTIIEQNAQEIRSVLGEEGLILEHHSNIIQDRNTREEEDDTEAVGLRKKLKLARDNWDSPIIFTTMVQFLNTFYSSGTRNVRRLHRLANAVLIFDEVQSVPVKCVSLFNQALNFLCHFGKSTAVLCTATQPALDFVEHSLKVTAGDMIHNLHEVRQKFKRVEIVDLTESQGWDASYLNDFVQNKLQNVRSLLVILNTKNAARKLFETMQDDEMASGCRMFHLSTNMCPAHRKEVLQNLKQALLEGERVVCVSTQLIEAGVNISFDCVIRSLAGLDSIAQAAGRCNRHGRDPVRNVYIIKSSDENLDRLTEIREGAKVTERVLREFKQNPEGLGFDLLSDEALRMYFQYYYHQMSPLLNYEIKGLQDRPMVDLLSNNGHYAAAYKSRHKKPFLLRSRQALATASRHFEVIEQGAVPVLVPYNVKANAILLDLNGEPGVKELSALLRQAQQYVIQVYDGEFKRLHEDGMIYELFNGSIYALRETAYSYDYGLNPSGIEKWEAYFA
ncbi:CRISPR-associated helicase/endonuclease Cas3 [Paenibacillus sambharensis]|uniref:CRISPR-associated helicase/endonuclease Cas3 n=1 Tax=Paenibacillus sambharensis TaxID=1803190 RepID=A0A2W1L9I8_9BACL|nr:CRISPR-associated helicase Cas3' [Paenibacillus sambharensis]PZD95906.1 CRISPR-associated helicase/endonuclease Cas3 [Paenibacillus sambharensis]